VHEVEAKYDQLLASLGSIACLSYKFGELMLERARRVGSASILVRSRSMTGLLSGY
jgi:hypothetical protein